MPDIIIDTRLFHAAVSYISKGPHCEVAELMDALKQNIRPYVAPPASSSTPMPTPAEASNAAIDALKGGL